MPMVEYAAIKQAAAAPNLHHFAVTRDITGVAYVRVWFDGRIDPVLRDELEHFGFDVSTHSGLTGSGWGQSASKSYASTRANPAPHKTHRRRKPRRAPAKSFDPMAALGVLR